MEGQLVAQMLADAKAKLKKAQEGSRDGEYMVSIHYWVGVVTALEGVKDGLHNLASGRTTMLNK